MKLSRTCVAAGIGVLVAISGCAKPDDKADRGEERTASLPAGESDAAKAPASPAPAAPAAGTPELAAIERGGAIVAENCARCHARAPGEVSKHASAPSFATLFNAYPPEYLQEAFAEGVFVGHDDMPAFEFTPEQINDLVVYLKTLGSEDAG